MLNKLSFNLFYSVSSTFINNVSKILLISIVSRFYSKEEFGLWAIITAMSTILSFGVDFGIVNSLRLKLNQLRLNSENSERDSQLYFYSAFISLLLISLFLFLITYIITSTDYSSFFLNTSNDILKSQFKTIFLWVQLIIFSGLPFSIGLTSFLSFNETFYYTSFVLIQSLITLILIFLLAYFNFSIQFISIFFFAINSFFNLFTFIIFLDRRKWFNLFLIELDLGKYFICSRFLILNGFKFVGLNFFKGIIENSGTIIAGSLLGLNYASDYNLVQKLYTATTGIYQSIFNPIWAGFSDRAYKNDWEWCKNTYYKTLLYSFIIISALTLTICIFGNKLLFYVTGNDNNISLYLFLFLGLSSIFYMLFISSTTFLSSIMKIEFVAVIMIFFSIIIKPFSEYFVSASNNFLLALIFSFVWFLSFISAHVQCYLILKDNLKK